VVVAVAAMSIRYVQKELTHPIEELCAAMRELAAGNREVYVPHENRQDEIGAMARYLGVIKKAAVKFECGLSPFARPIFSGVHPLL